MTTINQKTLVDTRVPIPPVGEQYAISSALAFIDAKRDREEAHVEALGTVQKGLLQQIMIGRLRVVSGAARDIAM